MASTNAKSYGAQLLKGQSLVTYIGGFTDYNPPRQQESVAAMTLLVDSISALNASEVMRLEYYRRVADERAKAFRNKDGSIERLIPAIRGAVESQYGKPSTQLGMIDSIIRRMRPSRRIITPAEPANPDPGSTAIHAERSYGSVTQFFNDIVNCLSQFPDYAPAKEAIKVTTLQAYAQQISTLNQNVSAAIQLLQNDRSQRIALYKELGERVKRIRAYIKAQYGTRSKEALLIARLGY